MVQAKGHRLLDMVHLLTITMQVSQMDYNQGNLIDF